MSYRPKLRQLQYFCALADCYHFGQAAKHCNVSQSTLSSGIHELEEALDVVLFERSHKGVLLTPVGKQILDRVKKILADIDDLVTFCDSSSGVFESPMKLGVIPTIAPFLLPDLLSSIKSDFPDSKIFIREDLSDRLIKLLHQGELDLILIALPWNTHNLEVLPLFSDELLFALPTDHSLASHDTTSVHDIDATELMLLEDGHCLRDHALTHCEFSGKDLSMPFQATSLNTLVQMVANGMGTTLLPYMATQSEWMNNNHLVTKRISDRMLERTIALAWRKQCPRQGEFERLANYIKSPG